MAITKLITTNISPQLNYIFQNKEIYDWADGVEYISFINTIDNMTILSTNKYCGIIFKSRLSANPLWNIFPVIDDYIIGIPIVDLDYRLFETNCSFTTAEREIKNILNTCTALNTTCIDIKKLILESTNLQYTILMSERDHDCKFGVSLPTDPPSNVYTVVWKCDVSNRGFYGWNSTISFDLNRLTSYGFIKDPDIGIYSIKAIKCDTTIYDLVDQNIIELAVLDINTDRVNKKLHPNNRN